MTAKSPRQNTPTEQNKADNGLVLYRLQQVEDKVDELNRKLDNQENIKKADLVEFREALFQRMTDKFSEVQKDLDSLQSQITDLKREKSDKKDVNDLKGLVRAGGAFITTIIAALVIYYLTKGNQ
jgi:23S rRNA C2498 (ribose-2'-O)-methylase RlmM